MSPFNKELEKPAHHEQSALPNMSTARAATPITPAQKIVESPARATAFLDYGTKISGKVHFEGSVRIDGNLDGEIDSKEITIGESAVVTAQVRADSIIVCGKVEGEINATQRIEIRATAKITGNIAAPKLIIHEGAIFEGRCSTRVESDNDQKIPRLLIPVVVTETEWRELT
jgi:cytoskeletal protein CcmA (bactofilin family)